MDRAEPLKRTGAKDVNTDLLTSNQKEVKPKATTGLNLIWENALKQYEADNNVTIDKRTFGVKKATLLFDESRHPHPEKQKAKFVAAVGGCLDWVDEAVGFISDNVDGTYATPAKIIAGAVSKLIKAAKDMSEDFNLITKTFEEIHNAIKDIGLLQNRVDVETGPEDHFIDELAHIFIALFDFCFFSRVVFESSRKRRYIRALVKGRDEKIMSRCENVTKVILLFRATVPIMILRGVEDIKKGMKDFGRDLADFPETFIKALEDMPSRPENLQSLMPKNNSLEKIKKKFFGVSAVGMSQIESQMKSIGLNYVAGTLEWLKKNDKYLTWFKAQASPFLCVSGPSGTGKTYFTYNLCSVIQETRKARRLAQDATKTQENISVAYFFFDPGKPEARTLRNALQNIIVQIASQDSKFCDTIAKDIETLPGKVYLGKKESKEDAKTLWTNGLSIKLERKEETKRQIYILLDGIDVLDEDDAKSMLTFFQGLSCDKTAIQVMMTGSPETLKNLKLGKRWDIDLPQKTRSEGDVKKIIETRISKMESLKSFTPKGQKDIVSYLDSNTDGNISFVDLTLSVMEQSGDEEAALGEMKKTYRPDQPKLLYVSMIEIVASGRSQIDTRNIETLFSWCTFAKERLSIYEIQQIWELDPSLEKFDVKAEILGKSKSMLYTTKLNEETVDIGPTVDKNETDPQLTPATNAPIAAQNVSESAESKLEIIEFRQPELKDYLLETPANKLIGDPLKAKVQIFITLCNILCDRSPSRIGPRKALYRYATLYFVEHLAEISTKDTSPQHGRDVVDALSRVMTNENNVCSIFEDVMRETNESANSYFSPLYYKYDSFDLTKRLIMWAKKMSYHEDEYLKEWAQKWVAATIKEPNQIFKGLARGHLENLSKALTSEDARLPYLLALRALTKQDDEIEVDFYVLYAGKIDEKAANVLLDFSKDSLKEDPFNIARIRIALALLLNESEDLPEKEMALKLYNLNLGPDVDALGPEQFYSDVGIAEYYASPISKDEETQAAFTARWQAVLNHAELALTQRKDEMDALGSDLDNGRCTTAFWLKATSHQKFGDEDKALDTCREALEAFKRKELEYTVKLLDFLTMMITILVKRGEHFVIIQEVQRCTSKMKAEWLLCRFDTPPQQETLRKESLRKAAVITHRIDFLIQMYEESIDYWTNKNKWYEAQLIRYELASIYRYDARVTRMAEITVDDIFKNVRNNLPHPNSGNALQSAFPLAVDIYYENFSQYDIVRSKAKKNAEVEKLKLLRDDLWPTGLVEGINLAGASLTLAKMFKTLHNMLEAKEEAGKAFDLCIADLQDYDTGNDGPAFRMLSQILMFAGLELDAGIALSLQFSDVSRKSEDKVVPGETGAAETAEDAISTAEDATLDPVPTVTHETSGGVTNENSLRPDPRIDKNGEKDNPSNGDSSKDAGSPSLCLDGVTLDMTSGESGKPLTKLANGETNGKEKNSGKPAEEPKQDTPKESIKRTPNAKEKNEWEEDLILDSWSLACSGRCDTTPVLEPGKESYYCMDCPDMDFCPDCYKKQVSYYEDMGKGFWFKCCWGKHQYLLRPVKDWHGVKDGIIRIGAKKKLYKLWLLAVKEKYSKKIETMT